MNIVENRRGTTRTGGVTGHGFLPGQSGNPGGRPKGLARKVRELVGEDGFEVAEFMFSVLKDERARTADRMEAARWLADRGFGRAVQGLEIDVARRSTLDVTTFATEDLEAIVAILEKYEPSVGELAASGEIPLEAGEAGGASRSRRRLEPSSRR